MYKGGTGSGIGICKAGNYTSYIGVGHRRLAGDGFANKR